MHALNRTNCRSIMLASVFACMLAGCGDANRSRIIGVWGIEQADRIMGRLNHTGTEKGELSGEPAAEPETPKMTLSFFGNGRLETSTKMGNVIQEKQGTWKFVSFDDSTEVMNLTCVIRGQESKHQVEFIDPETIKLVPPNMAGTTLKINFKRQD